MDGAAVLPAMAYTEQSAHQTSIPNIDIDICLHTYLPLRAVAISAFPFFCVKITMAMLMGANFHKFTRMEVKY